MEEMKNITILNMTRSMLKSKRLPKEFWAEPVACTIYFSKRAPKKKHTGQDTTRSMEWQKAKHLPPKIF